MTRWLGSPWAFVLLGGVLAVLTFPYLVSTYHLEASGRAVGDSALVAYNPLPALKHLRKAIEWEPNNAQAYRLLGQVYRAQGNWLAAVEALTSYIELRPDNPLGHIELAEVYEAIEAEMRTMTIADLPVALPQAAVKVPGVAVDTPHARPGGPAWHSYVATTTFSLPPNFGERPTLFMHAPSWVTYTLALPAQPAILRFGMGMDPQTHRWPGDGATFEVFLNGERVFVEHVDKAMARQGWHERTVDLTPWAGQRVALTLAVTPGPVADPSGDWAGWGGPQVVDARLPAMEAQSSGGRLVNEWLRAGLTAEDFIARGKEARKAEQYDEAVVWYERAVRLEAGLGDPLYFVGQLYESQKQWRQALGAYERAAASARLRQVSHSSSYYRMGIIYQNRLDPREPEKALAAFEAAVEADDFSTSKEAADCHYRRGQILRSQKVHTDQYLLEFRRAVELNPKHTWAHVLLGLAVYERDRDAAAAEAELQKALELAPQHETIYYHLGEIYRQEGRVAEAVAMYERALEIAPDFKAAQRRLAALEDQG